MGLIPIFFNVYSTCGDLTVFLQTSHTSKKLFSLVDSNESPDSLYQFLLQSLITKSEVDVVVMPSLLLSHKL